jgi:hypothetical protein
VNFNRCVSLLFAGLYLAGCSSFEPREFRAFHADVEHGAQTKDAADLDFHGLRLRSGQLIASDSGGADSLLLSIMGEQYTPFVHAGIVVIEGGDPFVYEGYATIRPFIDGPPTAAMRGRIRRVTLERFIGRQRVTAVFDPPASVDMVAVAGFARARHADGTPFDPYFDWRDHSQLYCTEFAALALHAGGAPLPSTVPIRDNRSLQVALSWLRISAPEIVTVAALTRGARRIGVISRNLDVVEIDAYFAAKQELHARFTADQKLGNVWSWSRFGLRLRPNIIAFLKASRARPGDAPADLALEILGPTRQSAIAAR